MALVPTSRHLTSSTSSATPRFVQNISTLEIRRDAKALVERLARGECFRITYRNKTAGELFPPTRMADVASDDSVSYTHLTLPTIYSV